MSGSLTKVGKRGRNSRYWFVLRNDLFAYYQSSTELYFPSGTIDLRYATEANIIPDGNVPSTESSMFTIATDKRIYKFRADTSESAHSWVKVLQKEIFRSRNEGDQVKIKIPMENILDVEDFCLFEIVDAIKIRAIDSDETYSIDEYVLAFLPGSKTYAVPADTIRKCVEKLDTRVDTEIPLDPEAGHKTLGKVLDSTFGSSSPKAPSTPSLVVSSDKATSSDPPSGAESPIDRRFMTRSSSRDRTERSSSRIRSVSKKLLHLVRDDSSKSASEDENNSGESMLSSLKRGITTPEQRSAGSDGSFLDVSDLNLEDDTHFTSSNGYDDKKKKRSQASAAINKVTELWMGGAKHFQKSSEDDKYLVAHEDINESNKRFRNHFSLPESEELVATYYAHIQKTIPIYGKIYVGRNYVCFRSLLIGTKTIMRIPLGDLETVHNSGFKFGYSGMVIVIHGHEEIFFDFGLQSNRDDAVFVLNAQIDALQQRKNSSSSNDEDKIEILEPARLFTYEDALGRVGHAVATGNSEVMNLSDNQPSISPMKFCLLTIGSRGDVQPYIALAKGLIEEGHSVVIASHSEFRPWVESYGIEYRDIAGDPAELMKIMIEHGMFSVSFLRDAASKFRTWIDELLVTSYEACKGCDVLIESPNAMAGIHVAEALQIPYFRAFTMPWSKTRAYPHAFIVPEQKMGGSYNYLTYVLFDNVFWKGISGQVNKWRKETLGLQKTNLELMGQSKVPFLYNVSPSVLVPPVDFSDWISVTGYWFLDEGNGKFEPPQDLVQFISKAKRKGKKLVYIGFGSIIVSDSSELTRAIIESVQKADVYCILSKGWSDRGSASKNEAEIPIPEEIYMIKSIPHDWLFPQLDVAVHHGGSGTTGASLRAGLPTIIKPFFGDQFFYANRVEDLGAGIFLKKLNVSQFAKALTEATTNKKMISKAEMISKKIRSENGVKTAIARIYEEMSYAESLVTSKKRSNRNSDSNTGSTEEEDGKLGRLSRIFGTGPIFKEKESEQPHLKDEEDEEGQTTDDSWMFVDSGDK